MSGSNEEGFGGNVELDLSGMSDQELVEAAGGVKWIDHQGVLEARDRVIRDGRAASTADILAAIGSSWRNPNLFAGKRGVKVTKKD